MSAHPPPCSRCSARTSSARACPARRPRCCRGPPSPTPPCSSGSSSSSSSAAGCAPATSTRSASAAPSSPSSSAATASSSSPTTTASRTPSTTSAATAARGCSTSPRAASARLQCPYHAWSYGFDGALRNAPHTDGVADFDPACQGLRAVRCAVVEGLVLLDPSGHAPPAEEHVGDLRPLLERYRLADLRRTTRVDLRGRGQLEGDRRELQRVPALPRRAPRAQPALALPLGRDARGRRAPGAAGR